MVISRSLAARLWPGESAVGKSARMGQQYRDWQTLVIQTRGRPMATLPHIRDAAFCVT